MINIRSPDPFILAPLHVTAVGKLMLAEPGDNFIHAWPVVTGSNPIPRILFTTEQERRNVAYQSLDQGNAYDDKEAEDGVGCIGGLIYDESKTG
ncbi:MAG: IclR family transcriptional regulator domain-containing protein [Arenicellales bacterium]